MLPGSAVTRKEQRLSKIAFTAGKLLPPAEFAEQNCVNVGLQLGLERSLNLKIFLCRLEVGTETPLDRSKSIKTFLMPLFAASGNTDLPVIPEPAADYSKAACARFHLPQCLRQLALMQALSQYVSLPLLGPTLVKHSQALSLTIHCVVPGRGLHQCLFWRNSSALQCG